MTILKRVYIHTVLYILGEQHEQKDFWKTHRPPNEDLPPLHDNALQWQGRFL